MATNRKKKSKRPHYSGGSSKKTRKKIIKVTTNRQQTFEAEGADATTQELGTRLEYKHTNLRTIICGIGMLAGVIMIILDIRDEGLSIILGDMEFSGSMVGLAMFIICVTVLLVVRPKVKITKKN